MQLSINLNHADSVSDTVILTGRPGCPGLPELPLSPLLPAGPGGPVR